MQPQHQTMTDCLADIIHIIHVSGKSGVLVVERGKGQTVEEGFITFVGGRVVEARIGPQSGLAAFNYLNTWQACCFALMSHTANADSSTYLAQLPPTYRSSVPDNTSSTNVLPSFHPMSKNNESLRYANGAVARPTAPFRLHMGKEMLQLSETMQLPRLHRRLLLLIDGQRGIHELARLMVRSFDEVQKLLNDLERGGLIRQ